MPFFPRPDLNRPEPLCDDLFGHGHGFDREKPPDLDKMWKDFNDRLNRLFRRKKKRKKGSPEEPPEKNDDPFNDKVTRTRGLKIAVCLIVFIAAVFWLGTGFFSVQEGQTGIITTFGRFSGFASPGINWRMPWPVQSH